MVPATLRVSKVTTAFASVDFRLILCALQRRVNDIRWSIVWLLVVWLTVLFRSPQQLAARLQIST